MVMVPSGNEAIRPATINNQLNEKSAGRVYLKLTIKTPE